MSTFVFTESKTHSPSVSVSPITPLQDAPALPSSSVQLPNADLDASSDSSRGKDPKKLLNPTQILNIVGLNPQQRSAAKDAIMSIAELSKTLQLEQVTSLNYTPVSFISPLYVSPECGGSIGRVDTPYRLG